MFAAAVLDGTPLPFDATDAVANLRVIEGIFAAAASRQPRTERADTVDPDPEGMGSEEE